MKKLLFMFSLLTVLVGSNSLLAFAQASGKAVVPPFDARYTNSAGFIQVDFLATNITSSPMNVTITIYGQTGSIVTTQLAVVTGTGAGVSNFVLNPGGGASASFTLAANSTAFIVYGPLTADCGYATIGWTQSNSTAQYGLIADVKENQTVTGASSWFMRTIAVNNGMPF
jgi:hypothetical protein